MLGFTLNEEQDAFRVAVRGFAEQALAPRVEELEAHRDVPAGPVPRARPARLSRRRLSRGIRRQRRRHGDALPPDRGDRARELRLRGGAARRTSGSARIPLLRFGTDAQKRELPACPALRGEKLGCWGLSEPNAGSDAASIRTTADAPRRRLRHQRLQDVHHQRQHRRLLPDRRLHRPHAARDRHQHVRRRHQDAGLPRVAEAPQDRPPHLGDGGAHLRGHARAGVGAARRRRGRLQAGDGHARGRPHHARGALGRREPGGARGGARVRRASASSSGRRSPSSRPSSSSSRAWRWRSRRRAP